MKRVTLRIPEQQVELIEREVERGRFPNRSEAIRTAVRELLEEHDGPRTFSAPRGAYQERDPRPRTDGGVISFEELEKRKQSNSVTPPEQRSRCPYCGDANPVRKVERNNQSKKDGKYRCTRDDCYAHFDEPATGYETREAFLEDQEDPEIVSDGGQVLACPECDATEISHRNGRGERALARTWHCHICLADFKEPNRRPPKTPGGTVSIPGGTGAAALAKMDPDDLVTDGGRDTKGIPCPECDEPKPKYKPCPSCGYEPYTTDGGRDISMELIEKAEEFDELQDAMLERGDDDARVAADICDDVREICLRLADVLERREKVRDRFRVDDDEVLTDGGIQRENIRAYTFAKSSEGWSEKASANLDRWGEQPPVELVLAIIEEVGEVADEVLETGRFDNAEAKHARVCLAAARDAGFATRSFLESFYEDDAGKPLPLEDRPELDIDVDADAVQDELDDLAPLLYQLAWALEDDQELLTDGGVDTSTSGSERLTPPPVLVVCCGRRLQVAVDNMVECPSCEELHRVQYSGRQKPRYDIGKTEIVSREVLEQIGTNEFGPTFRCPRCDYPSISEYCDCPECGWAGMCQEGWE